jgi:hypothetical protein
MMDFEHLDVERSVQEAAPRVEALHAELRAAYPALRGTLAIPGMFVGHGLESFVANGMTDGEIVEHTLTIVAQIRVAIRKVQPAQ